MFAARADQENAVHAHNKSLNGGLKGLSTKTPGKTPFKVPLNDENAAQEFGKTGGLKTTGKGGGFGLTVGKNGSKLDKSAFVTPAGKHWSEYTLKRINGSLLCQDRAIVLL